MKLKAEEHRHAARAMDRRLAAARLAGPTVGWLGEKGLWLEPQPWAILGDVTDAQQTTKLVANMDRLLRHDSPIGAMQQNHSPDITLQPLAEPGTSISGGVWPSLNATLVWALARVNGELAWDEWKKNMLARHAEVYPDIWYNTWSGPDTLNSTVSKHPGETVNSGFLLYTDSPIANLHSHACTLYSASKLLGMELTETGLHLAPALLLESFRFDSPLFGLVKEASGYQGWHAPSHAGEWQIQLRLCDDEAKRVSRVEVNGANAHFKYSSTNIIDMRGKSAPGQPLRWTVRY